MEKPSKRELYELYWKQGYNFSGIADRYGVTNVTVGGWLRDYGIPYDNNHKRDAFVFSMRDKRFYYQLYWGERLSYSDIASRFDFGLTFVAEQIRGAGIPTRNGLLPAGDPDEIPPQYRWTGDGEWVDVGDDPTADLPDNPDGSKYVNTDPEYDKDHLYELYWGYGLSLSHLAARLDTPRATLKDRLDNYGIPIREWAAHTKWEPHHGVPPKYEWPHDHDVADEEPSVQNGIWRQPTATSD